MVDVAAKRLVMLRGPGPDGYATETVSGRTTVPTRCGSMSVRLTSRSSSSDLYGHGIASLGSLVLRSEYDHLDYAAPRQGCASAEVYGTVMRGFRTIGLSVYHPAATCKRE